MSKKQYDTKFHMLHLTDNNSLLRPYDSKITVCSVHNLVSIIIWLDARTTSDMHACMWGIHVACGTRFLTVIGLIKGRHAIIELRTIAPPIQKLTVLKFWSYSTCSYNV